MTKRIAALFDIDGTLIITGGAGAAAWRMAFDELYGIPADIGKFTDTGMTDPDVGHRTFAAVLGREPIQAELNKVMERRLHYLYQTVADSDDYRVLEGVEELLPQAGLPARADDRQRRGRRPHQAAPVQAQPVLLLRRLRLGLHRPRGADQDGAAAGGGRLRWLGHPRPCVRGRGHPHDVAAAHAAGIPCVGVASHHYNAEELKAGGADWVIDSLTDGLPL
jgi:phosphoglycolate phosphatase